MMYNFLQINLQSNTTIASIMFIMFLNWYNAEKFVIKIAAINVVLRYHASWHMIRYHMGTRSLSLNLKGLQWRHPWEIV